MDRLAVLLESQGDSRGWRARHAFAAMPFSARVLFSPNHLKNHFMHLARVVVDLTAALERVGLALMKWSDSRSVAAE